MAAVYPAGPDPTIRHLTCSGCALMAAKIQRSSGRQSAFYHQLTHAVVEPEPSVPDGVVGRRSEDAHGDALHRVNELNAAGVQVNRGVVVGASRAVLDVPFDGAPRLARWCGSGGGGPFWV